MKSFVRSVCSLLDQGEPLVLATVVASTGSTPRSSGAKMAVRGDGSIVGTVGGGLAEAMACKKGAAMLSLGDAAAELMFVDMTQELAADSDMICGGGLTLLLETVEPGGPCAAAYAEVDSLMRRGVCCVLSTRCEETDMLRAVNHIVLKKDGGEGTTFEERKMDVLLGEPMVPPAPLYIFGAGHVSLFTARVGAMIGFRTVVLDDRADFANRDRFPEADEVVVLDSLENGFAGLDVGEDAFIVVVTRGHLHDRNVLAGALRTPAKYVGMIGSKKKRDKIYDSLLNDGFTQADIDRCYCPIGLTIGAQTPEEIAVSIAGELIRVRAGQDA
jgi:xanthine dehydrogenase accessory factor